MTGKNLGFPVVMEARKVFSWALVMAKGGFGEKSPADA